MAHREEALGARDRSVTLGGGVILDASGRNSTGEGGLEEGEEGIEGLVEGERGTRLMIDPGAGTGERLRSGIFLD